MGVIGMEGLGLKMEILTEKKVRNFFELAGFVVLDCESLIDGYSYNSDDPRFSETPPRCAWYFVKTKFGWIKIGNRKRVVHIEWKDVDYSCFDLTVDDVTKSEFYVHACSDAKISEYLSALNNRLIIV